MSKPEPLVDDWRNQGTCRYFDPEPWFPDSKADRSLDAREACVTCPVREQCARFALSTGEEGIWAGYHLPHEKDELKQYLELVDRSNSPVIVEPELRPVEHCKSCSCEVYRRRERAHRRPGQRVYGGHGMCATCYQRRSRSALPAMLVDPGPTVSHLGELLAAEMTLRSIAIAADLPPRTVQVVWNRRHMNTKIHRHTAERLRSVKVSAGVSA